MTLRSLGAEEEPRFKGIPGMGPCFHVPREIRLHHTDEAHIGRNSFFSRILRWFDILDPTTLLASNGEITNSKTMLEGLASSSAEDPQQDRKGMKDKTFTITDILIDLGFDANVGNGRFFSANNIFSSTVEYARKLCEASLHPDTGNIIPTMFRPPAFMPLATPLAVATLLPHQGTKPAFFWQLLFQSYSAGFNLMNRNETYKGDKTDPFQSVLLVGSVAYAVCLGAVPQFVMNRYKLTGPGMKTFLTRIVPVPLVTFLSAFNVVAVRMPEVDRGIEVKDKEGNTVGVSVQAGKKAMKETALSRAALMGVTAVVPSVLHYVLQGSRFVLRNPMALAPIKHVAAGLAFGAMVPVSFSLFPQHGTILRSDLEDELQGLTSDSELFYHRGL